MLRPARSPRLLTAVVALGWAVAATAQAPAAPPPASVARPGTVGTPAVGTPVDTLVDVGGYRLHFRVVPGRGVPIVFEDGGGDDASVWDDLLPRVAAVTGAPLVAYDRPGFGRSTIDTTRHGLVPTIQGLEAGLARLGYAGDVVLVAHSLGGFYAALYAARHPRQVRGVVLLDANLPCFFTDEQLGRMRDTPADLGRYRAQGPGRYYQAVDFDSTVALARRTPFPAHVPVLDVVSERTPVPGTPDAARWARCHQEFVAAAPAREGVTAAGTGHYVFRGAPELVVAAVAKAYARAAGPAERAGVLERAAAHAVEAVNAVRRRELEYRHSEADLNEWGYALLGRGERQAALAVFRLNAALRPESANAHDSLAEGYEAVGDGAAAIAAYRRALALNPQNRHAAARLQTLAGAGTR